MARGTLGAGRSLAAGVGDATAPADATEFSAMGSSESFAPFGGALNGLENERCEGGAGGTEPLGKMACGSCENPLKLATATMTPEPTTSKPSTAQVMSTTGLTVSSRFFGGGGADVTGASDSCE